MVLIEGRSEAQSIEDVMRCSGIDPERFGYSRIALLKRKEEEEDIARSAENLTIEDQNLLLSSPFIRSVTARSVRYTQLFDEWSEYLRSRFTPPEILDIMGIQPVQLSAPALRRLYFRIRHPRLSTQRHQSAGVPEIPGSEEHRIHLLARYLKILYARTSTQFRQIGERWTQMTCSQKITVCEIIKAASGKDGFSLSSLLRACSIPRSTWYGIMKSDTYGCREQNRLQRDHEDLEDVREIIAYKGFRKGSRQIKELLKRMKGKNIGRERILRIMKDHGLTCSVRETVPARVSARHLTETRVRKNALERRFRLNRPGEVILTDVTYLDYGNENARAYMSALKDPSSGRIHALLVSDSQDARFGQETVNSLPDAHPDGSLFHSDQGVLYLNPEFQEALAARGYEQSMSRRGNCWDNSPMESFFGHFKDECAYQECQSLEELRQLVTDYAGYYNYERPQLCRRNLTPVEFEAWLNSLNEKEWAEYLSIEEGRYTTMLEKAARSAVERARIDKQIAGETEYVKKKQKERSKRSVQSTEQ